LTAVGENSKVPQGERTKETRVLSNLDERNCALRGAENLRFAPILAKRRFSGIKPSWTLKLLSRAVAKSEKIGNRCIFSDF
jgi:hypothetical protein